MCTHTVIHIDQHADKYMFVYTEHIHVNVFSHVQYVYANITDMNSTSEVQKYFNSKVKNIS
jgi:hypothetical protein